MKNYEFRMRCTVYKLVTVEAEDEQEAIDKVNSWNVLDAYESELFDWEIESGPREV